MVELDKEVRDLYELAQRKEPESREALYGSIADLFERREDELSSSERELMLAILGQLSDDIEMNIRVRLAERLAQRVDAPHALVVMLANDTIRVARSVLEHSLVLRDEDLIEIIAQRTQRHQLAITVRSTLSASVCQALVETGDEAVLISLASNPGAAIAPPSMARMVETSRQVIQLQRPVLARTDLPLNLARMMFTWVSDELQDFICQRFNVDRATLEAELQAVAEDMLVEQATQRSENEAFIDEFEKAGTLSARHAVKALREGNIELFELILARLCDLAPTRARRLIYDPRSQGLAVVCKATGFERATFLSIYRLVRTARGVQQRPSNQEMQHIDEFFGKIGMDAARKLIGNWSEEGELPIVDIDDPSAKD